MTPHSETAPEKASLGFIALMATLMAMTPLSLDAMLPALGQIGKDLQASDPNQTQFIVTGLILGMALGNMLYGPFSDSYGRKPAIYLGLSIYLCGSVLAVMAGSMPMLLAGRLMQGFGASSCRVVSVAMIRDRFVGREMARVTSMIIVLFILVPVLAPSLGQLILFVASWRWIFGLFFLMGFGALLWLFLGQRETLAPENRRPFRVGVILAGVLETLRNPIARGYTLAAGLTFGAMMGFLASIQQILQDQYGVGDRFALYFALIGLAIGTASLANSRLVMRLSVPTLCQLALLTQVMTSLLFFLYAWHTNGHPHLNALMGYLVVVFFFFGMLFGNFNAMALQPLGHIAGVANSAISFLQGLMSAGLGSLIAQQYNGTVLPMITGFLTCGALALGVVVWTAQRHQRGHTI